MLQLLIIYTKILIPAIGGGDKNQAKEKPPRVQLLMGIVSNASLREVQSHSKLDFSRRLDSYYTPLPRPVKCFPNPLP